jgi:hypothetical protein
MQSFVQWIKENHAFSGIEPSLDQLAYQIKMFLSDKI